MSVEVDFFQTNSVMQAAGTQLPWVLSAPFMDRNHFYGVSFVPDSTRSNLQLVSLSFVSDPAGNVSVGIVIKNSGEDAVFKAAAIQAPNKF
jgi:hypothetical protein